MTLFLKWFGLIAIAVYLAGAFIAFDLFWAATAPVVIRFYSLFVVLALAALMAGTE